MKRITAIALLLFPVAIFAQKQVTNLRYVWTEHFQSPKKTDVKERLLFNFNWNPETQILVEDKKKNAEDNHWPRHIIDQKRRIVVVQMEKRNEYILEESDSFFTHDLKLEPLEETKTIKGFKCHGYTFKNEVKLNGQYGNSLMKNAIKEDFTLWVTDELQMNDAVNPYILALMRTQSAQGADFKGVLVEFDYKMSYGESTWNNIIDLDITNLDQKPETITWPWEMKDGVAWIEMPQLNGGTTIVIQPGWKTDGGNRGVYRKGDGSVEIMNTRLKALLKEITGQEKPKTKIQFFQNIFGTNAWGG